MKRNDAHDAGARHWKTAREAVRCPGCGQEAKDLGRGSTPPRWRCDDGRCPFAVGWRLEFADMNAPDSLAMVAVPLGDDFNEAVPWPRP